MGGPRPTAFKTTAGGDCERFTMKRSRWEKYTDKTHAFTVELPGKPEERKRKMETALGEASASFLVVRTDNDRLSYVVSILPLEKKPSDKQLEELMDSLRKAMLGELSLTSASLSEPGKESKLTSYTARDWTIPTNAIGSMDKYTARIRMFVAGDKLYGLMAADSGEPARSWIVPLFWSSFELPVPK
jgi:hypothetical protein